MTIAPSKSGGSSLETSRAKSGLCAKSVQMFSRLLADNLNLKQKMRPIRTLNDTTKYPRQEPELPLDVSLEVLANCKLKNSDAFKRTMMRSRDRVIEYPRKAIRPYKDRVQRFVSGRNVVQLSKLVPRYARAIRAISAALAKVDAALESQRGIVRDRMLALRRTHALALFDAQSHYEACLNEAQRRGAVLKA